MKVHLHTDKHVFVDAELVERIEANVEAELARYAEHLTRVEVHVSDDSAGKRTGADVRCLIEARPAGRAPIVVTQQSREVASALDGAVVKFAAALDHTFGRRDDRHSRETIRGH